MVEDLLQHRRLLSADCLLENPTNPSSTTRSRGLHRKACFSYAAYACKVIDHLRKCRVPISTGLSEDEFQQIQSQHGICFPPDLKSILEEGLPVGNGFPNWRSPSDKKLQDLIDLPLEWLVHQISERNLWWKGWGPRPRNADDALIIARRAMATLVPIYSHCYIPSFPNQAGNPVFLVFKNKDVLYCGYDLADFFGREIFLPLDPYSLPRVPVLVSCLSSSSACDSSPELQMVAEDSLLLETSKEPESDDHIDNIMRGSQGNDRHIHAYRGRPGRGTDVDDMCFELDNQQEPLEGGTVQEQTSSLNGGNGSKVHEFSSAEESPSSQTRIVSRYSYMHKRNLPDRIRAEFTIATPPWAAKRPRHIPFWSDVVEGKESLFYESTSALLQEIEMEGDEEEEEMTNSKGRDTIAASSAEKVEMSSSDGNDTLLRRKKTWLESYLKEVEKLLRRGGWKKEEIKAMIVDVVPSTEGCGGGGRWWWNRSLQQGLEDALDILDMDVDPVGVAMAMSIHGGERIGSQVADGSRGGGGMGAHDNTNVATPCTTRRKARPSLGDFLLLHAS